MPTSQRRPSGIASQGECTSSTPVPGREHDPGGRELSPDLRERRQRADVVDEAGEEEEARARVDAEQLLARRQRADEHRQPEADAEPEVDAGAADERCRRRAPAGRVGRPLQPT